jgi:protein SCO1/2
VLAGLTAASVLTLGIVLAVALGGSDSRPAKTPAARAAGATPGGGFLGGRVDPIVPAPSLALRDAGGRLVDISALRGRAVLVTFLYTKCPDICPLTADRLRAVLGQLSPSARARVKIIAVSVDPKNDTPGAVRAFLTRHNMSGKMSYLIGSASRLRSTWQRWGVAAVTDRTNASFVTHSALIYGIDARGRLVSVYPWNVRPADLAHDIPLLERQ